MIVVLGGMSLLLVAALIFGGIVVYRTTEAREREMEREIARREAHWDRSARRAAQGSTDPAEWITADDYPADALRRNQEGTVTIRWQVASNGRATDCTIAATSGHASLDRAACRAILRSARYPATAPDAPLRALTRRVVGKSPTDRGFRVFGRAARSGRDGDRILWRTP